MDPRPVSISIVFPAFNEAENIGPSIAHAVAVLDEMGADFEVIVVDDGSSDATRAVADRASSDDPRVRSIHHPRNRGYGAALKTGILAATKELIFFTDADLQFDLAELGGLLAWADRYDIIAGYRARRSDPPHRRLNAWAWGKLIGLLFDLEVRDIDCAFKVFRRQVFDRVPIHSVGAFVNSEILVRARAEGFSLKQIPVSHYPRVAGTQTGARPRVIARAFVELGRLHRELRTLDRLPAERREELS
ncbi:MAG: glycosyltransferase family 2 protein [Alphaproteobacteria bacterium]|nr:glycosyltransferase family 2 protein [Alphaproteobacteria bacterium]